MHSDPRHTNRLLPRKQHLANPFLEPHPRHTKKLLKRISQLTSSSLMCVAVSEISEWTLD